MQTERVTILMAPDRKARMASRAAARGISMGEYLRRKIEDEDELTPEQEAELVILVGQANAAAPAMQASIERIIATLDKSHQETDAFLRRMGVR